MTSKLLPFAIRLTSTAIAAASLTAPGLALAEDTESAAVTANRAEAGSAAALQTADGILVTAKREGYVVLETSAGTKTETPVIDVPQSITIIDNKQIADQGIRSIADLVRFVPGVTSGQGEGHRDQITLRGNNSTADFYLDGVRDDVQYFRSLYNIDRVEILKGPNAMIFGRGGGGGVVNRVTKSALADQTITDATASLDTFGSWYVSGDVNVPLSTGTLASAARLNGYYEELANHRDAYEGRRFGINPVAGFELGSATKLGLSYEYVDDDRTVDRGVPSLGGHPLTGYRDTFFGDPDTNRTTLAAHVASARLNHRFSDAVELNIRGIYGDYDKMYRNIYAGGPVDPPSGAFKAGGYWDVTKRDNLVGQADLVWNTTTGSIDHMLLIGVEAARQDTGNNRRNAIFASPNGQLGDPVTFPAFSFGPVIRDRTSQADVLAVYAQDQIEIGQAIELVIGLRHDRFELDTVDLVSGAALSRTDNLWSPRVGLIYKPVENASIYASYAVSYLPQSGDQFLALSPTTANLEPEEFRNYEIGAKWEARPGLIATAAVYQLDTTNGTAAGPVPGTVVLTGEQRTRGFEAGLTGRLTDALQIAAGYSYTDAKVIGGDDAGKRTAQVPKHNASLWARYQATDRLGLGVGASYQSKSFANLSNAVVLPGYGRLDLAAFYRLTDGIEAQINVENVTDATYFPVAHNDNNISTGAPINARFTLRARF